MAPYVNAEKLRGLALYITSNSGLPGEHDTLESSFVKNDPITLGYTLRRAARSKLWSTIANVNLRPFGTHSWGYWQDDLHQSWPMFDAALR
ncbi:hypothetical protein [Antrihabitans stalactiti]|uniref:Uncharacterized protein n=1 Tax=Antrihabitans stalactiti TaxID=2584121 RepID=A0A848KE13_9NOCA|nr:hypothetical protein [Antrihabitans stalactiti]NMN96529.1 hypothetical protein [Antrihabitans stalactiti]